MIRLLQILWGWISNIVFPKDYYAWQTLIYLGFFSFAMSWVARLAVGESITVNVIATAGWIFFALGIGWLLEDAKVRLFGLPVAPWVMGAIVCTYFFGLVPWLDWDNGFVAWPLVSVAIVAIPQFLTWELRPKLPAPMMRQQLILLLLIALLLSNWFQFYFRLQSWLDDYPSLLADDFSRSGFVVKLPDQGEDQARGIVLLTRTEIEIKADLESTPWPHVERWLLNMNEHLASIEDTIMVSLESSKEGNLWQLAGFRRGADNNGYTLDLMAIWSGPSANREGYYLEKICTVQPRSPGASTREAEIDSPPTPLAVVECNLEIVKHPGQPTVVES
ncbi:MAG: DUF5357 family protein [Cyanobacteria bacterium J06607_6]